jgi:hypothetical protein
LFKIDCIDPPCECMSALPGATVSIDPLHRGHHPPNVVMPPLIARGNEHESATLFGAR